MATMAMTDGSVYEGKSSDDISTGQVGIGKVNSCPHKYFASSVSL